MIIIGKIIGAILGYFAFGHSWFGALLGLAIGHFFDKGFSISLSTGQQSRFAQDAFFNASFSVMGYVAKADGRVSERELHLARTVMQQMRLTPERTKNAMRQFNDGKEPDFNLQETLTHLRTVCRLPHLLRLFLELQVQIAYADGAKPSTDVKQLLQSISETLGLGRIDFSHIEAMMYGSWQSFSGNQRSYSQQGGFTGSAQSSLKEAYAILGVTESVSDEDLKKAYRRKMNENHPDKLTAKGLPKEMIELATSKTQQIKAAYERIKGVRGIT
jgi:DnaJ like chaperone protein